MAKKEKVTLQELIVQTPELKASLLKFENVKLQLDKAAETCLQIKVTDDASLSICEQNLGKINELVKAVENVRVSEKAPHFEKCKAIDAAAAYVSELPESALKHLKDQKIAWVKLNDDYNSFLNWIKGKYNNLLLVSECDAFLTKLNKPLTDNKWLSLESKVLAEIDKYKKLVELKKEELIALENATPDEAEAIIQNAEEAKAEIESAVEETPIETISKIRRPWSFEVVDVSLVPLHFLMVDESKIKAYMKANQDTLKDGEVINGIKYYKGIGVTV